MHFWVVWCTSDNQNARNSEGSDQLIDLVIVGN